MNNLLFPLMPTWVSLDLPATQVVGLKGIYMLNFTDILHFNVIWINHFLQYGLNFCVFFKTSFSTLNILERVTSLFFHLFTNRPFIHLVFIFVYVVEKGSNFVPLHSNGWLSRAILWRVRVFFFDSYSKLLLYPFFYMWFCVWLGLSISSLLCPLCLFWQEYYIFRLR